MEYAEARNILISDFGHAESAWPEEITKLKEFPDKPVFQGCTVDDLGFLILRFQTLNDPDATACLTYCESRGSHQRIGYEVVKPDLRITGSDKLACHHPEIDVAVSRIKKFVHPNGF